MDSAKSLAGSSQNDRLGPHSLRHLQGARVRHGHVLRHQVALRPGQEEGGEPARAAHCQRQDRCRLRSEEHTSELQSPCNLVCRLLLEKKQKSGELYDENNLVSDYSSRDLAYIQQKKIWNVSNDLSESIKIQEQLNAKAQLLTPCKIAE